MTDENLLNPDTTDDSVQLDPNTDYLKLLTGPGGKFYDPDEKMALQKLARGKYEADAFIPILEKRLDEIRKDYVKTREENIAGAKLQELLDKLELNQQLASRNDNTLEPNEDNKKPSVDLKDVESLVSSKIQEHEKNRLEQENFNKVKVKLQERLGANYKNVLKEQSDSLGLTDEDVNLMARKNPNLFFKTFDLNVNLDKDLFQSPPKTERLGSFSPSGKEKRTWSYYLKLKEKDPLAWLDKKIAIQMEKDAQALGKDFYDA